VPTRSRLRRIALVLTIALTAFSFDLSHNANAATTAVAASADPNVVAAQVASSLFRTPFVAGSTTIEPISTSSGEVTELALATGPLPGGTILERVPVRQLSTAPLPDHASTVTTDAGLVTVAMTAAAIQAPTLSGSVRFVTMQAIDVTVPNPSGGTIAARTMISTSLQPSADAARTAVAQAGVDAAAQAVVNARQAVAQQAQPQNGGAQQPAPDPCLIDKAECMKRALLSFAAAVAFATAAQLLQIALCSGWLFPPIQAACISAAALKFALVVAGLTVALAVALSYCDDAYAKCMRNKPPVVPPVVNPPVVNPPVAPPVVNPPVASTVPGSTTSTTKAPVTVTTVAARTALAG